MHHSVNRCPCNSALALCESESWSIGPQTVSLNCHYSHSVLFLIKGNSCLVMQSTVLMSLLQPQREVYNEADDIMLLAEGEPHTGGSLPRHPRVGPACWRDTQMTPTCTSHPQA